MHAQSELFKEFGEQSPLEKMHACKTLGICSGGDSNLLAGMAEEDVRPGHLPAFVSWHAALRPLMLGAAARRSNCSLCFHRERGFVRWLSSPYSAQIWPPTLQLWRTGAQDADGRVDLQTARRIARRCSACS